MISFWRVIKFGFQNFWRNPWLSLATVFTFALTLFIISVFFFLVLVTQTVIKAIEEKMDLVVYIKDEAKEAEILQLEEAIRNFPGVKSVKYISKEEALPVWQNSPYSEETKQIVTPERNPLPRSLQIKVKSPPEDLEKVTIFLANPQYQNIIRSSTRTSGLSYKKNKLIITRLGGITKFVKKIGLMLAIIFLAISILVIFNTVRLTIISRKDEIEIQRLVGAKNSFIQGPFLVEGVLYGFLATILSTLFIYLLLRYTSPLILQYLGEISFDLKQFFTSNLFRIFVVQFLIGVFVAGLCSLVSVRKYLKI